MSAPSPARPPPRQASPDHTDQPLAVQLHVPPVDADLAKAERARKRQAGFVWEQDPTEQLPTEQLPVARLSEVATKEGSIPAAMHQAADFRRWSFPISSQRMNKKDMGYPVPRDGASPPRGSRCRPRRNGSTRPAVASRGAVSRGETSLPRRAG